MLDLIDITKVYRGGHRAVDGISLGLRPGVLGLLGPNGAGKSTLMRIAATAARPTSGRVLLDGADASARPRALRRTLGYLPQDFGFYPNLTAREFLSYLAAAKGVGARAARVRIGELLDLVGLGAAADRRLGGYSGGMLRRVGIAQALVNDPRVIILDEPTAGLDPEERARLHALLSDLAAERAVVLSTHIVPDVEDIAAEVAVVAAGRLVLRGRPADLVAGAAGQVWEALVDPVALPSVGARFPVVRSVRDGELVRVRLVAPERPLSDAVPLQAGLEDVYRAAVSGSASASGPAPAAAHRAPSPGAPR
ncbi:ATP-binding cassette domain-containing protein [Nocardiopsis suaedae]|uniref:ATP-binding cassette domain-containing protein n=1 Tax=Nocardiopsis suaedae TaxID=3018444 RepID=A0ABT4TKP4_9ACTN|nr:ATP-binding cassette domain-containing protein [Nocardiopsis suaedae]MDA2805258.1 ATP-binding cassette domain-containing protein [Nocardiopsis suaedae]